MGATDSLGGGVAWGREYLSWRSGHRVKDRWGGKAGGMLGGCSGDSGEVERTAEQEGRGRAERRGGWGSGYPPPHYPHLA